MHRSVKPKSATARYLRRFMTPAEKLLWRALRDRRLGGYKFKRQMPIGRYIVDFLCEKQRLVIELDGGSHTFKEGYERTRDHALTSMGCRVLHLTNSEVLDNLDDVLIRVLHELDQPNQCMIFTSPVGEVGEERTG